MWKYMTIQNPFFARVCFQIEIDVLSLTVWWLPSCKHRVFLICVVSFISVNTKTTWRIKIFLRLLNLKSILNLIICCYMLKIRIDAERSEAKKIFRSRMFPEWNWCIITHSMVAAMLAVSYQWIWKKQAELKYFWGCWI